MATMYDERPIYFGINRIPLPADSSVGFKKKAEVKTRPLSFLPVQGYFIFTLLVLSQRAIRKNRRLHTKDDRLCFLT